MQATVRNCGLKSSYVDSCRKVLPAEPLDLYGARRHPFKWRSERFDLRSNAFLNED